AVGVFSEIMARILKLPSTVFSIPGIFPLVPGIAAYETIQFLLSDMPREAGGKMVETLTAAGAIAFGIFLVTAFFRMIFTKGAADRPQSR
ncbi:MAG: threonine/serine exporter, partial [Ruminiclostridium sp.]|nr:threonine/serine exporter [Ruminiclostridium sp.]